MVDESGAAGDTTEVMAGVKGRERPFPVVRVLVDIAAIPVLILILGMLFYGAWAEERLVPRGPDAPHLWVEGDGVMRDAAGAGGTCVLPRGAEISVQADDTPLTTRLRSWITYSTPPVKVTVIGLGGPSSTTTCPVGGTGFVGSYQVETWSVTTGMRGGMRGTRPVPESTGAGLRE